MPNAEALPPVPIEIPWRLAATTQRLKDGDAEPDETTISLFYYEPGTATLEQDYTEERPVYLKLVVSVSPFGLLGYFAKGSQFLKHVYLEGGLPVWHLLVDLKITSDPPAAGGMRPYFHAAAPLRREMIETGVIGAGVYEGEADAVSVGRSASQLHETASSMVKTKSKRRSVGFGTGSLPGGNIGVSTASTATVVDSERHVDQSVETTVRDASQERRELLSHTTNVENVLSLLHAKHVGSPYLRFSLWPRPVRLLALDAADPNVWYHELLQQRSSGVEGIQEFFAVAMMPTDRRFCVEAKIRRFCVLDAPPKKPKLGPAKTYDATDEAAVVEYLYEVYPRGTPVENLDVIPRGLGEDDARRVVFAWHTEVVQGAVGTVYLAPTVPSVYAPGAILALISVMYKEFNEVYLEMSTARYQEALARSPLERGVVLAIPATLKTCFTAAGDRLVVAGAPTFKQLPETVVDFAPQLSDAAVSRPLGSELHTQARYRQILLRWNMLHHQFAQRLANLETVADQRLRLNRPELVQQFLAAWADLPLDDPANLPLPEAAAMLGLGEELQRLLREAGVADLRSMARWVNALPAIERRNREMEAILGGVDERVRCAVRWKPVQPAIPAERAGEVREAIVEGLRRASEAEDR